MGRYFTEEQIDDFISAYLQKYPDAVIRMQEVMRNPLRDNSESMGRSREEIMEMCAHSDFFIKRIKEIQNEFVEFMSNNKVKIGENVKFRGKLVHIYSLDSEKGNIGRGYAFSELMHDLTKKIANSLLH